MASSWDTFAREGQEGSGGDFPDRPHVPDGVYKAEVTRIGEPYDKANAQSGEMETKFAVEFTLPELTAGCALQTTADPQLRLLVDGQAQLQGCTCGLSLQLSVPAQLILLVLQVELQFKLL